jgi:hypothetical protein
VNATDEVTGVQGRRECGWSGVEDRAQVRQLPKVGNGAIRRENDTASQSSGKIAAAQLARIASPTTRNATIAQPWKA